MLKNLFAPLAMKVAAGIILALIVALGIALWRADAISDERERLRNSLAASEAQHAVTVASLDALSAEMEKMVRDGELRRERLSEALEHAKTEGELLRDQADAIRAAAGDATDCVTPGVVLDARGL